MTTLNISLFAAVPRRMVLTGTMALALLGLQAHAADKLPVTASFSILGDIVRTVGGDRVTVTTLVGPDEDAHVFEPKPSDAKNLLVSKLVVNNGLGFEPWADKLVRSAGYKGDVVIASKGVKARTMQEDGHVETDPHAWQNPANVMVYVRNIAVALGKADPDGASTYQANAQAYIKELQTLDAWAKDQFAALGPNQRKAITSHDAFGYLAAHYGLTFLAPQGASTDVEPSVKQVARLIRQIKREKIRAVFVENMSNPQLIDQLSKDAGATLGATLYADALSGPEKPGASYLQMMRHNVNALVTGMARNVR